MIIVKILYSNNIYQVAHIRQEVRSRQPQVGENTLQKNTSYIYHTILSQNASIQILALADNACLQSTAHQETRDFDLVTLGPPSKILEDELRLEVKLSHEQLYHLPLIVLSSSSSSIKQNFLHFCSFAIRDGLSFVFAYFCFLSTIFFSQETNFAFPGSRCLKLQNFFWVTPCPS